MAFGAFWIPTDCIKHTTKWSEEITEDATFWDYRKLKDCLYILWSCSERRFGEDDISKDDKMICPKME